MRRGHRSDSLRLELTWGEGAGAGADAGAVVCDLGVCDLGGGVKTAGSCVKCVYMTGVGS